MLFFLQNGSHNTKTLKAPNTTTVSSLLSKCGYNLTNEELEEDLVLSIPYGSRNASDLVLSFRFTRNPNITGDKSLDKSLVDEIKADYRYDPEFFPDTDSKLRFLFL